MKSNKVSKLFRIIQIAHTCLRKVESDSSSKGQNIYYRTNFFNFIVIKHYSI